MSTSQGKAAPPASTSAYKSTILIVTLAGILAAQLGYGTSRPGHDQLMLRANVDSDTTSYYLETYGPMLMQLDLVCDTFAMFQIKAK